MNNPKRSLVCIMFLMKNKKISLTSNYGFKSGYKNILLTLLENLNFEIYPRTYQLIGNDFKKYFEYITEQEYNHNCLDLVLLPINNCFDVTNPFLRMNFNKSRILHTMWESTRMNDLMIEILNEFECLIVPNKYNKINFIKQGITTDIHIVPLFCNTNFFKYRKPIENDIFTFGISNEDPRKNIDRVLNSFLKAFGRKKDVRLKIKTCNNKNIKILSDNITIDNRYFTKEELRDWYYDLDVYVSGATCEGWGMMQQESMCCGRPLIYTDYGGLSEFTDKDCGFEIGFKEEWSEECWGDYGGKWSSYNEDEMIESMLYCYNNREEVINKGILASKLASQFTVSRYISEIESILQKYL